MYAEGSSCGALSAAHHPEHSLCACLTAIFLVGNASSNLKMSALGLEGLRRSHG